MKLRIRAQSYPAMTDAGELTCYDTKFLSLVCQWSFTFG